LASRSPDLAVGRRSRRRSFSARSPSMFVLVPSPFACCSGDREGGIRSLCSIVRVLFCRSWSAVVVVGATPRQINLPQLHSHTSGVLHGAVSELMISCVCRFLGLAALSFLDGVMEAEAMIPSGVSILLLCPCCYVIGYDIMVEQGGCVVQKYAHTVICAGDR
jgi:hypothetical protein